MAENFGKIGIKWHPCERCGAMLPRWMYGNYDRVVSKPQLMKEGLEGMWRCGECDFMMFVGVDRAAYDKARAAANRPARKTLGDSYKRRDHFSTSNEKGESHTHFAIAPKLEKLGHKLPKEFSGNSEALAQTLGMSHAELAGHWELKEDDLRQLGAINITH
jgi:hypothetical protein